MGYWHQILSFSGSPRDYLLGTGNAPLFDTGLQPTALVSAGGFRLKQFVAFSAFMEPIVTIDWCLYCAAPETTIA
jgi:hypothetical protein